ncbi:LppM family (lipo)protein [Isoptericola sp. NPDC055881]
MNTPHRRAPARTALAALGAVVSLLVLAGCMKIDMDMIVSEDDTISGSMIMALQDDAAESLNEDPQDLWDQWNKELTPTLGDGMSQEEFAQGGFTGTRIIFKDQPLHEFNAGGTAGEELTIVRDDDAFVVDGVVDLSEAGKQLKALPRAVRDTFEVRLTIGFPGPVFESNGTIDGNQVTWLPPVGKSTEIHARARATAHPAPTASPAAEPTAAPARDGVSSSAGWYVAGLVALILVVVLILRARTNRARATSSEPSPKAFTGAAGAAPGLGDVIFGERPRPDGEAQHDVVPKPTPSEAAPPPAPAQESAAPAAAEPEPKEPEPTKPKPTEPAAMARAVVERAFATAAGSTAAPEPAAEAVDDDASEPAEPKEPEVREEGEQPNG